MKNSGSEMTGESLSALVFQESPDALLVVDEQNKPQIANRRFLEVMAALSGDVGQLQLDEILHQFS